MSAQSIRPTIWTPQKISELAALWPDPTIGRNEIADRLGVTPDAAGSKALKLGLRRPRPCFRIRAENSVEIAVRAEARDAAKLKAANIWHLIDLKRAGYKGGHGELAITSQDRPARLSAPFSPVFSQTGSFAAMCAE